MGVPRGSLPSVPMDDRVRAAIAGSFLAGLSEAILDRLLDGSQLETAAAGTTTYVPGREPRPALVVSGLLRTYFAGPDGRQVTVRYARPGDVLGVIAAHGGPAPLHTQAITDTELLRIDRDAMRELARTEPEFAWALIGELTETIHALWMEVAAAAFATVPQRVARHLLEIAAREQEAQGGTLVARVSQQELADLAGSVREVVARALRELRDDRIVRVSRSGIVVLDAGALAARAWPREGAE